MDNSDLDNEILQSIGGNSNSHSFVRIIDSDTDVSDLFTQEEQEPQVIRHSSYHTFDQIVASLQKYKNKFSIFSTNIQSLGAKWNEFQIFIERLKLQNCYFSALCIQETWLEENADTSNFELDGYTCIDPSR